MYHFVEAITNTKGDALIGYYVKAVDTATGSTASLYADTSSTPIISVSGVADTAKVDSDGNASFYISGGEYHLDIYATDATTFVRRIESIPMVDFTVAAGNVATVAALQAKNGSADDVWTLTASGRHGLFKFDASNLSAEVTADTAQGVYIAPSSDTTGASGAWVRQYTGPLDFRWFGAVADCTAVGTGTDNTAAFNAAVAVAALTKGHELLVPRNIYGYRLASSPNQITGGLKIRGQGFSQSATGTFPQRHKASMLVFDQNVAGLKFIAFTDNNADATANEFESSIYSVIEDIMLYGGLGTTVTAHGLETRVNLHCRNVRIDNFAGNGLFVQANTSGPAPYGNASLAKFDHCVFRLNGCHGARVTGIDSNIIEFANCDFSANGGAGVLDDTTGGGNSYIACHFNGNNASNGAGTAQTTQVQSDYAGLSDSTVGSIVLNNAGNNPHTCVGCYVELGGTGYKAYLPPGVTVINGLLAQSQYWHTGSQPHVIDAFSGTAWINKIRWHAAGGNLVSTPGILAFTSDAGWGGVSSDGRINYSSSDGLVMGGSGTTNDWKFFNKSSGTVMYNPTGTQNVRFGGSVLSTSATGGIGYLNGVGAGGAVTQATSRSTGVTLNNVTGAITLVSAAGSTSWTTFTVTNSAVAAQDTIRVCQASGTDKYQTHVTKVQAGSFDISFATTGGTTTEQPVFNFSVIKGATS
jgi:hypothetical protein